MLAPSLLPLVSLLLPLLPGALHQLPVAALPPGTQEEQNRGAFPETATAAAAAAGCPLASASIGAPSSPVVPCILPVHASSPQLLLNTSSPYKGVGVGGGGAQARGQSQAAPDSGAGLSRLMLRTSPVQHAPLPCVCTCPCTCPCTQLTSARSAACTAGAAASSAAAAPATAAALSRGTIGAGCRKR